MPDTFDLERAFDDLARDVTSASRPRGAADAIRSARRRRAALATAAVVAVAAVGGLAAIQLGGDHGAVAPARQPSPTPTSPATPTGPDAATLQRAFGGWLGEVTEERPTADTSPRCLTFDGSTPREFAAGPGTGLATSYAIYPDAAAARTAYTRALGSLDSCTELRQNRTVTTGPDTQARVLLFTGTQTTGAQIAVLAVQDHTVGLLTLTGIQDVPPGMEDNPATGPITQVTSVLMGGSGSLDPGSGG